MVNSQFMSNRDLKTIESFGDEWDRFDQTEMSQKEHHILFANYFSVFPWELLPPGAVGFDLGCGSGRWAALVAPRVGKLYCIDPAAKALEVAQRSLAHHKNVEFCLAGVDDLPLAHNSMDFGYAIGVLHHTHDTLEGLKECVRRLKVGAPLLVYIYYALDNRPFWFRFLFKVSTILRFFIARLPKKFKNTICEFIALFVYYPLARFAHSAEKIGVDVQHFPLAFYKDKSYYMMRTDALDRFGTRLEKRFTRAQVQKMLEQSGLDKITFSEKAPFWCAVGFKKA